MPHFSVGAARCNEQPITPAGQRLGGPADGKSRDALHDVFIYNHRRRSGRGVKKTVPNASNASRQRGRPRLLFRSGISFLPPGQPGMVSDGG